MVGMPQLRNTFWVEATLASVTGVLAAVTLISREWIEVLTGWDPDNGNGLLEWSAVLVLAAAALLFSLLALAEWTRTAAVPSP